MNINNQSVIARLDRAISKLIPRSSREMTRRAHKLAFSLIELIIVLAIIAILTTIAYPIYRSHLTKAHRVQATVALTHLAAKLEQYYIQHHSYQKATLQNLHVTTNNNYYQFVIKATSTNKFSIQAVPISIQAKHDSACGTLALDELGQKTISGNGNLSTCWP